MSNESSRLNLFEDKHNLQIFFNAGVAHTTAELSGSENYDVNQVGNPVIYVPEGGQKFNYVSSWGIWEKLKLNVQN